MKEAVMKALVVVTVTMALGILGTASPSWSKGGGHGGGAPRPCDLSGVNPARHKAIFNHPDVAKSYGFIKGPDGNWQVMANCQATGPK
jgi:hypothetical protein